MNHKVISVTMFLVAAMTYGCAPLQQAPLVYSSKVVVGVDVSMSVAENQGGSINIGMKSVDSAYVPVAVSKTVDEHADNKEKSLEITIIAAKYGEGTSPDKQDDAAAIERNRKIDEYFVAKQALKDASDELSAAEKKVKDANALIDQVESLKTGLVAAQNMTDIALAPQRAVAFQKSASDISAFNVASGLNFPAIDPDKDGETRGAKTLAAIESSLGKTRNEKSDAEKMMKPLKSTLQAKSELAASAKREAIRVVGLSQTDKTDAMSVYGRFDSTGKGDATNGTGSLLVGKVFSTGLASQNLTEAVKISAKNSCVSNAFSLAQLMTVEKERNTFIATIDRMCGYAKQ